MASLQKNVASQHFTFATVSSTSGLLTTSTSTSQFNSLAFWAKDGTQAAAGGTFTSLGSGQWDYSPTQTETNATNVSLLIAPSATIPVNVTIWTDQVDASGFFKVDVEDIKGVAVSTTVAQLAVNTIAIGGVTASASSTQLWVNVANFGGTVVTGRDIGASVLLSSGTGVGQIILGGSGQVTVATNNDKTGYTLTATAQSSMADVILDRDMSLGVDSGSSSVRTPRQSLRAMRNKIDASSGTTLIVFKEDDATVSWTASITASSGANPIVTLTPP